MFVTCFERYCGVKKGSFWANMEIFCPLWSNEQKWIEYLSKNWILVLIAKPKMGEKYALQFVRSTVLQFVYDLVLSCNQFDNYTIFSGWVSIRFFCFFIKLILNRTHNYHSDRCHIVDPCRLYEDPEMVTTLNTTKMCLKMRQRAWNLIINVVKYTGSSTQYQLW